MGDGTSQERFAEMTARTMSRRSALKVMGGTTAATVLGAVARGRGAVALAGGRGRGGATGDAHGYAAHRQPWRAQLLDPAMSLENWRLSDSESDLATIPAVRPATARSRRRHGLRCLPQGANRKSSEPVR